MREPTDEEYAQPGHVVWHSSEQHGGPDVGMTVGLGNGQHLWCGEISRDRYDASGEAQTLGDDSGFWLVLYGPGTRDVQVLGKLCDNLVAAHALIDALSAALKAKQ